LRKLADEKEMKRQEKYTFAKKLALEKEKKFT